MSVVVYILAVVMMFLGIGGLAYDGPKRTAVRLASVVSIISALIAFTTASIIPLVLGFAANWLLRLAGQDPGYAPPVPPFSPNRHGHASDSVREPEPAKEERECPPPVPPLKASATPARLDESLNDDARSIDPPEAKSEQAKPEQVEPVDEPRDGSPKLAGWLLYGGILFSLLLVPVFVANILTPEDIRNASRKIHWSEQDRENVQHFRNSCAAMGESIAIAKQSSGRSLKMREQAMIRIRQLYKKAMTEAGLVDNYTLKKIHPDLPPHFREEYEKGIELRIKGWDEGRTSTRANQLLTKYQIWLKGNAASFRFPVSASHKGVTAKKTETVKLPEKQPPSEELKEEPKTLSLPLKPKEAPPRTTEKPKTESRRQKIVIWNQHNAWDNNFGSRMCNVILYRYGTRVWRKQNVRLAWTPGRAVPTSITLPSSVRFNRVRVEITKWVKNGGGLGEIQVLINGVVISKGCQVKASAYYDARFLPRNVVDGIVQSLGKKGNPNSKKGYWLLPSGRAGWIELRLKM